MARDAKAVIPQSEGLPGWYNDVVYRAKLVDQGPAKGTMVIRPYGYRIWELLQSELDARIKSSGHENAYFPLLIPYSYLLFEREAKHVDGFRARTGGRDAGRRGKTLDEPLVVRPTSGGRSSATACRGAGSRVVPRSTPEIEPVGQRRALGDAPANVPADYGIPLAGGPYGAFD